MYRVVAIAGVGLFLAACSSNSGSSSNPFSFEPMKETLNLETQPPGADAKASSGQTCRTPCALAVPADKALSITFTLAGYQPATEDVQLVSMGDGTSKLQPDPVSVELTPLAPAPKKKAPVKRAAKPKPVASAPPQRAPAPPPAAAPAAPPQPQTTSPWPSAPSR
jgi:hypothetical protein